jgi:hypothetical protein
VYGCKLLGKAQKKGNSYRLYELKCGHLQEVMIVNMLNGDFACKTCLNNRLAREAEAQGCKLLGKGRNANFRLYELSCGHRQEMTTRHMRTNAFACQTCEETSRTKPSNLYLLHVKVESDEWLKLGYAKDVSLRVSKYGLSESAIVTTVRQLHFDTGNEAHLAEAAIHSRHIHKRLPQKYMKPFHTVGGWNECYPVTMLDTLLEEFESLKLQQESVVPKRRKGTFPA